MDNKKKNELNLDELGNVNGGLVMSDPEENKFWLIRQDGTIIAPAPTLEDAVSFAKGFSISPTVITKEEYKKMFGRNPEW